MERTVSKKKAVKCEPGSCTWIENSVRKLCKLQDFHRLAFFEIILPILPIQISPREAKNS